MVSWPRDIGTMSAHQKFITRSNASLRTNHKEKMKANSKALLVPVDDVLNCEPDIVIIGSGPAGVAVAEYVFNVFPEARIVILERGDVLTMTHVSNVFPDEDKAAFINAHGTWPWDGYFKGNGLMMFALGGRGIVAGGLLRRFDKEDFSLWENGKWPIKPSELDPFYTVAEIVRKVAPGECESPAQTWVMGVLDEFKPHAPPWGVDVKATGSKRLLDSSVQRLCELIHRDCLEAHKLSKERRLLVSTNTQVTKITFEGSQVTGLVCQHMGQTKVIQTTGASVILAASPVESARLILESGLHTALKLTAAGKFLAEHILSRTEVITSFPIHNRAEARVNVFIPPPNPQLHQRFQIDVRHSIVPVKDGKLRVRISGFAAMDPDPKKMMKLNGRRVNTVLEPSSEDNDRVRHMEATMIRVARRLGATEIPAPQVTYGRSNHEVGTLRMGHEKSDSATDANGKIHGLKNLFVGDASVFPCVGVANPMLTITALAYRLAKHVGRARGLKVRKDLPAPWSLC